MLCFTGDRDCQTLSPTKLTEVTMALHTHGNSLRARINEGRAKAATKSRATTKSGTRSTVKKPTARGRANALTRSGGHRSARATAAIKKAIEKNGGTATLQELYTLTKKFKKDMDVSEDWKAGLRGVLYREIRNGKNFKKLRATTYGLI